METGRHLGQVFPPLFLCLFSLSSLSLLISFSLFVSPFGPTFPFGPFCHAFPPYFFSSLLTVPRSFEDVLRGHSASPPQLKLLKQLISLSLSCVLSELCSLVCAVRGTLEPADKMSWGEQVEKQGK